jgi:2-oxoglutarate ferredoxin oxidoreductase subunit delta
MKVYARTPLDVAEIVVPQGVVYLIPERCKDCKFCIDLCPRDVLEVSAETNSKGYHIPKIIEGREEFCVNCEFCTMVCPEFAIFTLESAE